MLLNKHQKLNFINDYPTLTTPLLCQKYGASIHKINGLAKALGIYKTKIGKFKKVNDE